MPNVRIPPGASTIWYSLEMKRSRSSEDCRQAATSHVVNCSTDAAVLSSAVFDWEVGAALASPPSPGGPEAEPWTNREHADYLHALERGTTRKVQKLMHLKGCDMREGDFLVQRRMINLKSEGAKRQLELVLSDSVVADEDDRSSVSESGFLDAQVPRLRIVAGRAVSKRTSQRQDEEAADNCCTQGTAQAGWEKMWSEGCPTRRLSQILRVDSPQASGPTWTAPTRRQCAVPQAKKLYPTWKEWTEESPNADGSLSDECAGSGCGSGVTFEESSLSEADDALPVARAPSSCPGLVDALVDSSAREGSGGVEDARRALLGSSGKQTR